jgi:hypothetical protein
MTRQGYSIGIIAFLHCYAHAAATGSILKSSSEEGEKDRHVFIFSSIYFAGDR